MTVANYDTPRFKPTVTTRPCGCVTTESGGHTHVKLCAACKASYFKTDVRDLPVPNNLDLVGG